jgi:hypothetical protein
VRTREQGAQLTMSPPEAVWKGEVATTVLSRAVITLPNARLDVDPARGRFLVLERSTSPAAGLRSPVVVLNPAGR